jgi:anti-sigma-K factor RskA
VTATALRDSIATSDAAALQLEWSATTDDAAVGASGDVVWSARDQAGVMRIRGLQPNDPTQSQYQLWIFDAARDERFPVDGGVFDVPAGDGEVLVPIDASLPVRQAMLFAVTVERPGGVVVSDRERIVLVAEVSG